MDLEHKEERDALRSMCDEVKKSNDPVRSAQFGELAADLVPKLIGMLEKEEGKDGGRLGEQMREALAGNFLVRFDGRSLLARGVSMTRLNLWYGETGVAIADVRLEMKP